MKILTELNPKTCTAVRLAIGLGGLVVFFLTPDSTWVTLGLGLILALLLRSPETVYAVVVTFKRDAVAAFRFIHLNIHIALLDRKGWSIPRIFQEVVKRHPQKQCFLFEDRALTFQEIEDYSNRVGAYFKAKGLQHGDCVALLMETRPEYVCLWLGLAKIGVITALINSNLRRDTLLHSIKVAKAKAIIVGTELTQALEAVLGDEDIKDLPVHQFCEEAQRSAEGFSLLKDAVDLSLALESQDLVDLSADIAACSPKDKLLYVYTSGTTGLPKAAVITNLRYLFMATGIFFIFGLKEEDVVYNPLPLYHSAGGIVGVGNGIVVGCTVALRKKFSASNFWKDCIKYDCSIAQYIGELCRYLLATPPKPEDTQHRLRLMYGNGLRPQIWSQFVTRFNIPVIGEVYGSTEGNSNLANMMNQVGAVGFIPPLVRPWFPVQLIKCDDESGEPIRDSSGHCIRCKVGETGLMIGVVDPRRAVTAFHGYADKAASEKKVLRNVFKKDDCYFNTGDMIVMDLLGYLYFKDRTGDTFRWRGENVATQEVEAIITNVIGLQDCVVYGVEVPHVEGKAGMAAIVDPDRKVDLQHLSTGIRGSLPAYAQPLFVRLMDEIPRTTTFKMKKRDLVLQGFDIHQVQDPIYFLQRDGSYRPLTEEQFQLLQEGKAGL